MVRQRVANTLKLGERDAQGALLHPALAHHIAEHGNTVITDLRQRIGTRLQARSCHTTCEQFSSTTPQRSSQRRESESAVVQLADMMVNQRFILAFAQMRPAAQLIDKTPAQLPNMPAAFTRVEPGRSTAKASHASPTPRIFARLSLRKSA